MEEEKRGVMGENWYKVAGQVSPPQPRPPEDITKKNWEDYLQYYREARRRESLRRKPRDLRCPQCRVVKLKPKQWVRKGICKSCSIENKLERKASVNSNVFKERIIKRYVVDGFKLRRYRQELGLTLKRMSHMIGWTHSWLCKLEVGDVRDISAESYAKFQRFVEAQK